MTFIALFILLLIVLAAIALLDVLWQRHQHIQQLRMSRQDVKDEHKANRRLARSQSKDPSYANVNCRPGRRAT